MVRAAANGLPLKVVAGAVDFDDQQVTGRHRVPRVGDRVKKGESE